jgi:chromosome segregation ATPase
MKTIDNDIGDEVSPDATTGEYPVIDVALAGHHLNGAATVVPPGSPGSDDGRAAFWLAHMETEINRLREKWDQIDAEFKVKDARIVELHEEIRARDATAEELNARLQENAAASASLEERLADNQAQIAALVADRDARAAEARKTVAALAAAEDQRIGVRRELDSARTEIARLHAAVERERSAAADVANRNEALIAEQGAFQAKVQDLETYIDGRHQRWSDMNTQIAGYKDTLAGFGKTLKGKDVAIERQEAEKRALMNRVLDLERQGSELIGRRKEREAAYEELQQKLADHLEATERLKIDIAKRAQETEQLLAKSVEDRELVESLERDIVRRDEKLAGVEADLEKERAAASELAALKEQLAARVEELQGGIEELRLLKQDYSEQQVRLARADQQIADLERLRATAVSEVDQREQELSTQRELVASLDLELHAKQATLDFLQRNVQRITDLGASLAALDRRMTAGADAFAVQGSEPGVHEDESLFPDFVSTVASGEQGAADLVDIGVPHVRAGERKLVAMMGGEGIAYPLRKAEMTIGRGKRSDIRIPSHFISRVHAKISTQGIATVIEDAGSKNGILVNSERVKRCILRDGDIVSLGGELDLRFVDAGPSVSGQTNGDRITERP